MLQVPENKYLPLQRDEDLFEVTESEFMVTLLILLLNLLQPHLAVSVSEEVQSGSPRVGALWVGSTIFGWHVLWTTKFNLEKGVSVRRRGLVGHGKAEVSARKNLKDQVGKWCDWQVCCWRWDRVHEGVMVYGDLKITEGDNGHLLRGKHLNPKTISKHLHTLSPAHVCPFTQSNVPLTCLPAAFLRVPRHFFQPEDLGIWQLLCCLQ